MIDIIAQHMKFVACLKLLTSELSTLASGFEVDGGQLRFELFKWLEREIEVLQELCDYQSTEVDASSTDGEDEEMSEDVE